jgi:hypothetical protein
MLWGLRFFSPPPHICIFEGKKQYIFSPQDTEMMLKFQYNNLLELTWFKLTNSYSIGVPQNPQQETNCMAF